MSGRPARVAAGPVDSAADDEALLGLPLRRLGLRLGGTPLEGHVATVHGELAARGLFLPHVWLSTSFFSPDGVPGIALPFYLTHPRLLRLERRLQHHADGASATECLAYLRHEAGHALDTAYQLFRRRDWRAAFGLRSAPYRRTYACDPGARDFVRHLPRWYAQSHPAEDFAETFAVWLQGPGWRRRYPDGPARSKLELVDALMDECAGTRPPVRTHERYEALSTRRETLGSLHRRRSRLAEQEPRLPLDDLLGTTFPIGRPGERATTWLRRNRRELAAGLLRRGHDDYGSQQVLELFRLRLGRRGATSPARPARSTTLRALAGTLVGLGRGELRLAR